MSRADRFRFIEVLVSAYGYINRKTLADMFEISIIQTSHDFRDYMKVAPDNLVYDKTRRCYVPSPTFSAIYMAPSEA